MPHGAGAESTPPHDIVGQPIAGFVPKNGDALLLLDCMAKSREVFQNHPVNVARVNAGKAPATQIWPWSGENALHSRRSRKNTIKKAA